ncbi:glycosyltransferase like family 2-domain-containing protein [Ampelomyces quisqualis]|uniref:Glycosyltransferase like family 2-domain-containing protein n=1 Tax=Ampelomyces quisqualis TaxID=50730 RepID=A0A6A5QEN9_AMPQU|nr:glycosyltransferase like family 2-domain-containing protein [Ampelomyces quisqualis]
MALLCASLIWTTFLIYDVRRRLNPPSERHQLGLLYHNIPALLLLTTTLIAKSAKDTALVWFVALMVFRYWRTLTNIWFWFQYELVVTSYARYTGADCTIIVPTVGTAGNGAFDEMVAAILINCPARLIFSTNSASAKKQVEDRLSAIQADVEAGTSVYQKKHRLDAMVKLITVILVINASVSNKRAQVVHAFSCVETDILVMVDDTAVWQPRFLQASLPAFQSQNVGFVGTRKWVNRRTHPRDPTAPLIAGLWKQYVAGFWNTIGALYLVRHNFEIRATNSADGGVFCVSGRSSLIRTNIVKDKGFTKAFLNEYVLRFGTTFPGWGPVTADDDNFITRWVINHGYDVKIQSSKDATITTTLGTYPLKFPDQCKRWSRTTFRQNPIALFVDRTVWSKWPLTVWTTLFPWLYNAALIWDGLAVYTLACTYTYAQSSHRVAMLCSLVAFIWLTKLVKTIPWFWEYPMDFLLYFVVPAYPAFAYWHSLLKLYTAFTFWDLAWSGRKLK